MEQIIIFPKSPDTQGTVASSFQFLSSTYLYIYIYMYISDPESSLLIPAPISRESQKSLYLLDSQFPYS